MSKKLLAIGVGYTVCATVPLLQATGWQVSGSTRSVDKLSGLKALGVEPFCWPGETLSNELLQHIETHQLLLVSAAPVQNRCPLLSVMPARASKLRHIIYLSSTGVYGDHGGAWIDEDTPLAPTTIRGKARLCAEQEWQAWCLAQGVRLTILRLAGIYGKGRNAVESLADETRRNSHSISGRRIYKEGHVFNRIHVDDVARIIMAALDLKGGGEIIYNVCDDEPSPPQDVVAYAADLLEQAPPPLVSIEEATLSPMARSFYADNKRLKNERLKNHLKIQLLHPNYRSGLEALHQSFKEHQ